MIEKEESASSCSSRSSTAATRVEQIEKALSNHDAFYSKAEFTVKAFIFFLPIAAEQELLLQPRGLETRVSAAGPPFAITSFKTSNSAECFGMCATAPLFFGYTFFYRMIQLYRGKRMITL